MSGLIFVNLVAFLLLLQFIKSFMTFRSVCAHFGTGLLQCSSSASTPGISPLHRITISDHGPVSGVFLQTYFSLSLHWNLDVSFESHLFFCFIQTSVLLSQICNFHKRGTCLSRA